MTGPIPFPREGEFAPFYAGYLRGVEADDPVELLENQVARLADDLRGITEEAALHRYAEGKWSVKEMVGHLIDTERVMTYRILCIGRRDPTPLPGFDEKHYVAAAGFDSRSLAGLLDELGAVRRATQLLVAQFKGDEWRLEGEANGTRVSLRAILWIIVGHFEHHRRVLRERYGVA